MKPIRGPALGHAPTRAPTDGAQDLADGRADRLLAVWRANCDALGRFEAARLDITELPDDLLPDLFVVRVGDAGLTPVLGGMRANDPLARLARLHGADDAPPARCLEIDAPVRLTGPDGTRDAGILLPLSTHRRLSHVLGLLPSDDRTRTTAPFGGFPTANLPLADMPEQAEILAYWTGLGGPGRLPARRDIDPVAIPRLLRHLMMLDVLGPPLDFRYRLLGDEIMLRARPGLKGRRFSEIAGKGPGSGVWESARKVAETGLPRYGRVGYIGPDQFTAGVINLLMPLSDDGHTISQVLLLVLFCQRDLQAPDDRPV